MTETEFIQHEIAVWGVDYVFDLLDRGYTPTQLIVNGTLRWWWILPKNHSNQLLTQTDSYATMDRSRSVVSPVSTVRLTDAE